MAVIKEYMNGACHIKVYDDKIRPPEEVKQIIDTVSMLVYSEELRKHMSGKLAADALLQQKEGRGRIYGE